MNLISEKCYKQKIIDILATSSMFCENILLFNRIIVQIIFG